MELIAPPSIFMALVLNKDGNNVDALGCLFLQRNGNGEISFFGF
jgi:hypothetical protein